MSLLVSRLLVFSRGGRPPPAFAFALRPSSCSAYSPPRSSRILATGDVLKLTRSFSAADVEDYSRVSGDFNPLHSHAVFARTVGFEAPIVHGMLVASLFPALVASHFPGAIYISQTLHFKLPVYIGEELSTQVQAVEINKNKDRFIAKFQTKCVKKGERVALDGEARAILPTLSYKE